MNETVLQQLYDAFNQRDIDAVLSALHPKVQWANGMEGGFVYGREAVRDYWTKQFTIINSQLDILNIARNENQAIITLRQVVRDLEGNLLLDKTVLHNFTIENGLITLFEIADPLEHKN